MVNSVQYLYSIDEVKASGKKWVLSIGRRQPMHFAHMKSLSKILNLKCANLIYVIGSANTFGDVRFDPFKNPLTVKQQIEQFYHVFGSSAAILLPLKDYSDTTYWANMLIQSLAEFNITPSNCIIYFIGKDEDKLTVTKKFLIEQKERFLTSAQWEIEVLVYYGFTIWMDHLNDMDLTISAKNFRALDLRNLSLEERKLIAAPDYLCKIAQEARKNNVSICKSYNPFCIDKESKRSITLYDLSIQRILKKH